MTDDKTYLLRGIPLALWNRAKHAAVDRGISLRELILTALRAILEDSKK